MGLNGRRASGIPRLTVEEARAQDAPLDNRVVARIFPIETEGSRLLEAASGFEPEYGALQAPA